MKHQRRCSRLHALKGEDCSTARFLRKLDESLAETFLQRPLEAISDSPGIYISDTSIYRLVCLLTILVCITIFVVDVLFERILSLSPKSLVLLSLRDPLIWAQKRMQYHSKSEIVCNENLWTKVPHPFDLVGCMKLSSHVTDSLITFPDFNSILEARSVNGSSVFQMLADAYKQMNTYNAGMLYFLCFI